MGRPAPYILIKSTDERTVLRAALERAGIMRTWDNDDQSYPRVWVLNRFSGLPSPSGFFSLTEMTEYMRQAGILYSLVNSIPHFISAARAYQAAIRPNA